MTGTDGHARLRFAALVAREPIPLAEAALSIAEEEYPRLDVERYLLRLDRLGERVRARAGATGRAAATLEALRAVLAGEEGLRGNDAEYHDPRNSFLNEVLDRRLGIPISLSVVWMEVARRAGLRLDGVGLPGHFLSKYVSASGAAVFVDAYRGGEMFSAEECAARHRARTGRDPEPGHLAAVSTRQILGRMLANLRRIYLERRDDVRAWWVLDRILLLAPEELEALRERGIVAARLGAGAAAERDFEAYLARAGTAPGADEVRAALAALRARRPLAN